MTISVDEVVAGIVTRETRVWRKIIDKRLPQTFDGKFAYVELSGRQVSDATLKELYGVQGWIVSRGKVVSGMDARSEPCLLFRPREKAQGKK